jgi:hypothetical protein
MRFRRKHERSVILLALVEIPAFTSIVDKIPILPKNTLAKKAVNMGWMHK